jgi:hypothetical protein
MQRDMMQPGASLAQEATHYSVRTDWFQQLEAALAQRDHRGPHSFVLYRLLVGHAQAQSLVKSARCRDAFNRYAEVIDARALHGWLSLSAHARLPP